MAVTPNSPSGLVRRFRARTAAASRSAVVSALVVAYLFGSGVIWALITPMGGVADEPSHIVYAAGVVRGDLGDLEPVQRRDYDVLPVVAVPIWTGSVTDPPTSRDAFPPICYAFDAEVTAACVPELTQSTELAIIPTGVTRYPPPYYAIAGLPTLAMAGEPAVYAMRITSAALAAGMIALGLAVAAPRRRTWLALGAAITFTPMVGHFAGSVNPSALEISAALGLGIGLMGIDGTKTRSPVRTAAFVGVLCFAVAWSRPRSYLTLIAVLGAAALINSDELRAWLRHRVIRTTAGLAACAAVVSAFIYETQFTGLGYRVLAASTTPLGLDRATAEDFAEFERRFINLGFDMIGRFGWLDHSPPRTVSVAWILLALSLIVLALAYGRRRDRQTLVLVGAGGLIVAPLFVIMSLLSASVYQARYHLPLAVLVVVGAIVILARLQPGQRRGTAWKTLRWGAILAPVAMIVSIASSLHRYSIGGKAQLADLPQLLIGTRHWLPPAAPLLIAGVGAVIILLAPAALRRLTAVGPEPEDS